MEMGSRESGTWRKNGRGASWDEAGGEDADGESPEESPDEVGDEVRDESPSRSFNQPGNEFGRSGAVVVGSSGVGVPASWRVVLSQPRAIEAIVTTTKNDLEFLIT